MGAGASAAWISPSGFGAGVSLIQCLPARRQCPPFRGRPLGMDDEYITITLYLVVVAVVLFVLFIVVGRQFF